MRRSSVMFLSRAALLALALVGSACDNGPDTTARADAAEHYREFTGTITLNGAITHPSRRQTSAGRRPRSPPSTPAGSFIGFQLGTWSGVVCTAVLSNERRGSVLTEPSTASHVRIHVRTAHAVLHVR